MRNIFEEFGQAIISASGMIIFIELMSKIILKNGVLALFIESWLGSF